VVGLRSLLRTFDHLCAVFVSSLLLSLSVQARLYSASPFVGESDGATVSETGNSTVQAAADRNGSKPTRTVSVQRPGRKGAAKLLPAGLLLKRLDPSNPEALLASLEALVPPAARRPAAEMLQRPRFLTGQPFLNGRTIGETYSLDSNHDKEIVESIKASRGGSVRAIADGFLQRKQNRDRAAIPMNRLHNHLVAVQSAPGGGKSAALDILGLLSARRLWNEDLCPDEPMRDILNLSIPIAVTHNSGSSPSTGSYDANDKTGLALRILYSFFVMQPNAELFSIEQFFHACFPGTTQVHVSPETALEACILWAKRETGKEFGILLLVDEIAKMYDATPTSSLVAELGTLLDVLPSNKLNVVCTTLDTSMLHRASMKSGRRIVWAGLPAFPQEVSERLFRTALHLKDGSSLPPALRIAISDASGHPRTLQYLLQGLLQSKNVTATTKDLKRMRRLVLAGMDHLAPSFALVRAALCGQAVPLDEPLPGLKHTPRELIAEGSLVNTDATQNFVFPKLSMFRLLQFAHKVEAFESSEREAAAGKSILFMAEAEADGASAGKGPSLEGRRFERFFVGWLQLMSILRANEETTALTLFHGRKLRDNATDTALDAPFTFKRRLEPGQDTSKVHFHEAVASNMLEGASKGIIATFADNNPAFDVLVTAPCNNGSAGDDNAYVALAVETGFSSVGGAGNEDEVSHKLDLFNGIHGRLSFDQMKPPPKKVAYVYATAGRHLADAWATQAKLAREGVLLLCRDQNTRSGGVGDPTPAALTMERALSPTLAERAFFLLQLDKKARLRLRSGRGREKSKKGNANPISNEPNQQ
jgi:hypothetical protein